MSKFKKGDLIVQKGYCKAVLKVLNPEYDDWSLTYRNEEGKVRCGEFINYSFAKRKDVDLQMERELYKIKKYYGRT
jgi:hypothetical protein